jgi:hypothetical protein
MITGRLRANKEVLGRADGPISLRPRLNSTGPSAVASMGRRVVPKRRLPSPQGDAPPQEANEAPSGSQALAGPALVRVGTANNDGTLPLAPSLHGAPLRRPATSQIFFASAAVQKRRLMKRRSLVSDTAEPRPAGSRCCGTGAEVARRAETVWNLPRTSDSVTLVVAPLF